MYELLYERAPTDAELSTFGSPSPTSPPSARGVAKAAFGLFVVVILLGALFAHYGAR